MADAALLKDLYRFEKNLVTNHKRGLDLGDTFVFVSIIWQLSIDNWTSFW